VGGILKNIQRKGRADRDQGPQVLAVEVEAPIQSNYADRPHSPERGERAAVHEIVDAPVIDRRKAEAAQLLDELVKESGGSGTRVVKRHQIARSGGNVSPKDNSLPDWQKPVSKLPVQLESALAASVRKLNAQIRHAGAIPADVQPLIKETVAAAITDLGGEQKIGWKEQDLIVKEITAILSPRGPLEALFADLATTEIFIDSHRCIKARRRGQLIETPFGLRNADELELFTAALVRRAGTLLSAEHPIVDCSLEDETHALVNALHGTVAGSAEPRISIRIPRAQKVSFYELLQAKALPATLAAWLAEVISQGEANILIVGTANSGKTMLTSALASEVGSDERVITVEELPEIQASTTNLEKLIAKPGAGDAGGAVTIADLVKAAVRRQPRRLILGDLKEPETKEFLRALEGGLTGCIASIHGEYPEDGLWRLLDLLALSENAPQFSLMRRIVRSVHLVISLQCLDEKPCVVEIAEVLPIRAMEFQVLPLVQLESVNEGKRLWRIVARDSYWMRKVAERGSGLRSGPALLPYEDKLTSGSVA